jgi:hypothetical protein
VTRVEATQATEPPDLPCARFVLLVTEYLEGALDPATTEQVAFHVGKCRGCGEVLRQWQTTIELTGELAEAEVHALDPHVRADLVAAFRTATSEAT